MTAEGCALRASMDGINHVDMVAVGPHSGSWPAADVRRGAVPGASPIRLDPHYQASYASSLAEPADDNRRMCLARLKAPL